MIDLSTVVSADAIEGEDPRETERLKQMVNEAAEYLQSFRWCLRILESYLGVGVAEVVAVCLFKIEPAGTADEWLWVIVGDLPPAYIVTDDAPDPVSALQCYITEMRAWVDAVRTSRPTSDLIPVNAESTRGNADDLDSRLNFLEKHLFNH